MYIYWATFVPCSRGDKNDRPPQAEKGETRRMRWTKKKKRWTILFLLFCSSLCGCDPAVQEKLSDLSEMIQQPLRQYQNDSGETSLPTLQEILGGKETSGVEDDSANDSQQAEGASDEAGTNAPEDASSAWALSEETTSVKLFFLNAEGSELLEETRQIAKVPGIARETLEALIEGPAQPEAAALFPEGTTLRDINITEDGICKVDFSQEIQGIVSKEREEMVTLAIIKTLSQFPSIQTVQFMVEGLSVHSLTGNS